jgi:hypothetical protein
MLTELDKWKKSRIETEAPKRAFALYIDTADPIRR